MVSRAAPALKLPRQHLANRHGRRGFSGRDKYIAFSYCPAGYTLDLASVGFGVGRSATGPRNWQWRSSGDGFTSPFPNYSALNANVVNNGGLLTHPDATTNYNGNILDLNAGAFQDLGTGTITFRFYGYNAEGSGGTGGLAGNLTITGTYDVVVGGCGLIIGTPFTSCNDNTPGLTDTYDLSIPYTGIQGDLISYHRIRYPRWR